MTPILAFSGLCSYLGALKTNPLLSEGDVLFSVPEILLLDVRDEREYVSARLVTVTALMQKPIKDEGGCNDNWKSQRRRAFSSERKINWDHLINTHLKEFRLVRLSAPLHATSPQRDVHPSAPTTPGLTNI